MALNVGMSQKLNLESPHQSIRTEEAFMMTKKNKEKKSSYHLFMYLGFT